MSATFLSNGYKRFFLLFSPRFYFVNVFLIFILTFITSVVDRSFDWSIACRYSDYREFTCPLCRKRTQLPVGGVKKLADNFLVSSLSELVGRQRPSKYPFCDICKLLSGKHRDASSKCLDCAKLLCAACVQMHKQTKASLAIINIRYDTIMICTGKLTQAASLISDRNQKN